MRGLDSLTVWWNSKAGEGPAAGGSEAGLGSSGFSSGSIVVQGYDIRRNPVPALAGIGIIFQQPTVDLDLSVLANLRFHARLHGMKGERARVRIQEELARLGLSERAWVLLDFRRWREVRSYCRSPGPAACPGPAPCCRSMCRSFILI